MLNLSQHPNDPDEGFLEVLQYELDKVEICSLESDIALYKRCILQTKLLRNSVQGPATPVQPQTRRRGKRGGRLYAKGDDIGGSPSKHGGGQRWTASQGRNQDRGQGPGKTKIKTVDNTVDRT
ncbi:hypothetical protein BGZ93_003922, partial [Podila epicladia]